MATLDGLNREQLSRFLQQMQLIRVFEERAGEQYMLGNIKGFLHLYIGEEAIAVGAVNALQPQDYVVTHYRDHGHALARGVASKAVMAELFGKATGCSRGKGGSMHLFDVSHNFMGGYAIVGGQLPIATGLALAAKQRGTDQVVLCFFGDGALNQGEFHESMNLASLWKLPVVFFLENNMYGMGTHVERTYAGGRHVYTAADHYAIPSRQIDGMDVAEVHETTTSAVDWARQGKGPYFLEALTYRFRGHSIADPAEYRRRTEEEMWAHRDPVATFRQMLVEREVMTEEEVMRQEEEVTREVDAAVEFANESPFPELDDLFQQVMGDQ